MGWADDAPISGESGEALHDWESMGLGPPDDWQSFHVELDADGGEAAVWVQDADGEWYGFEGMDIDDIDSWDWAWDLWDWLEDNYPDVDKDTKYA